MASGCSRITRDRQVLGGVAVLVNLEYGRDTSYRSIRSRRGLHGPARAADPGRYAATGRAAAAPLNPTLFRSRLSRLDETEKPLRQFYTALDAGYISQNVYLFCAAYGLATVARGLLDRRALATAMRLEADQRVILAQSVGYPA